jgi:hypothetical protein
MEARITKVAGVSARFSKSLAKRATGWSTPFASLVKRSFRISAIRSREERSLVRASAHSAMAILRHRLLKPISQSFIAPRLEPAPRDREQSDLQGIIGLRHAGREVTRSKDENDQSVYRPAAVDSANR